MEVVRCGKGVVYLTSPGCPTDIGLQSGKACYPCSRSISASQPSSTGKQNFSFYIQYHFTEVASLKEDESNAQPFRESLDRRSQGGTFSDCYRMVVSRITHAFLRRDRDVTHAESNIKVACETERPMKQTCFPSTGPARKDIFEYHKDIPSRRDLFNAMEELCKPRLGPYIEDGIPMTKCFYQDVDYYVTSVLIELFNNEPNLSKNNPMMSELLNNIINEGMICDMNWQTTRKKQNRRYTRKKTYGSNESDCRVSQDILHKTRYPKFLSNPPFSLYHVSKTILERATNTGGKEIEVSEGPENITETLSSPVGRQDQSKLTKDPLAERIVVRGAKTKVTGIPSKRMKGAEIIRSSLTGRIDVHENSRTIENYVSPNHRLEVHTEDFINLSEGCSLESTAPVSTTHLDHRIERNLKYAMAKTNRMIFRIAFAIGRDAHTIFVNIKGTESFWRLVQRLLNSFQLPRPATQRLKYKRNTDAVLQYIPNEQMTNITVDLLETGSFTVTSVPVSVIKLLLHMFTRSFRTACTPSVVVGRYQAPEICRYRLAPKRLNLRNESQRISIENLRDTLQPKHGFSFWRHFPRARDTHIIWKSYAPGVDNKTAATKEEESTIADEIHTPGKEKTSEPSPDEVSFTVSEHLTRTAEANSADMHTYVDTPGDGSENDEATRKDVCTSLDILENRGAAAPESFVEEYAKTKEGTRSKDYQNFDDQVPDNLLHIKIASMDITELEFKTDVDGNRAIFVSGGFGDICQAHLLSTEEEVIVKIVKNMTYEDVLRETRIQTYLMTSVCVPPLLGIIGGPDRTEMMIVQQMCAKGRTLYDLIEACLAESVVLVNKHWLELCYQLAINLENMHDKGILHNDIKTDNILVDLKANSVRIYFIDFGQATFRSGGILHFDDGDDSDDTEDYLAPEVCSGLQSSPKSDIYSLGVIFADIADEFCECLGQLADDMCEQEPVNRPTLEEVSEIIEELIMENEYS